MNILVTGSSGHLGHALVHTLQAQGHEVIGLDVLPASSTAIVGSITNRMCVRECMQGIDIVLHAATLHKPHVATHPRQQFIDTNISGTLNLLEEAHTAAVRAFVFTSTTSTFGRALTPQAGEPASWITEDVRPLPKNIYGITKIAAEDLCELFARKMRLPCIILRTSRFFPEEDDRADVRAQFADENSKVNELLYRRADLEDIVTAHVRAIERAADLKFGRYIISATTPFSRDDAAELGRNAPAVVARHVPEFVELYAQRDWRMLSTLDRVYVNERARTDLGWQPKYDFKLAIERLRRGEDYASPLTRLVGSKGYHAESFEHGPYPVD